ncbi:FkbM family methyltransferase [Halogeometricum luteum]|uniref:FkbM family methyltransferase n=1 Tax=Halogeometricum luteum TaxID=2950537 RepID=A0ABU2G4U3_9EURY|nr:FkbM family methyltransferase [Halogeometricum sp. S3BR5-2]MDS0295303.1 FkbM family methyltransferase [Halogeometricum sp. S3BR5-2]
MTTRSDDRQGRLSDVTSKGALLGVASRLANRYDVLGTIHRAYWRARLAAFAEGGTVRVGGTTARFAVATRSERRRVRHLGGERFVLEMLLDELTGDETLWDVGACVGTYACLAAGRLADGHVVAFEPEPTNRRRLESNLRENAPASRWTALPTALSDYDGSTPLASEFTEAGGGHHRLAASDAAGGGTPVEVRRGAGLCAAGVPAPDVLKVDVQGAELQVLRGMGAVLDGVGTVYVEMHREKTAWYGSTTDEVEAFLADRGYATERLGEPTNGRPGVYFLRAHR